ncbi:MAG TPA: efflux transporter outer membrane subunit [Opitutaceae bacterium]|nr:efflux transporter outer membrane subunit [Opitutaceae bacterium]
MPSRNFPPSARLLPLAAVLALAAGCAVGPTYHRPTVATPAAFKEAAGWKQAAPADAGPRGAWWEVFQDPVLSGLEAQVATSNFTLQEDAAAYEQARQIARADRGTFLPLLDATGSAERSRAPAGRSLASGASTVVSPANSITNSFSASLQASWQPDFWGRIRQEVRADVAAAQASAADLANARLSIQSELARDYIALRVADQRQQLLNDAANAYARTLEISRNKYAVGVSAHSDVLSAQAQLDATRAAAIDAGVQRAQFEHAIAVLVGKAPADFAIIRRPALDLPVPGVPAVLPSELLERRPDIAAAERRVAEANARVGVQWTGYFPSISLTGQGGYSGSVWRRLFEYPNRFWSLGASATETLLDWGQRRAQLKEAEAAYDSSVAGYRGSVLTAFQQVEDNLAALRILEQEATVQQAAVSEAAQATVIASNEYRAGTADYTTVATAEVSELNDREQALATHASQLDADLGLIVALGGGWQSGDVPERGQVMARRSQAPAAVAAPAK